MFGKCGFELKEADPITGFRKTLTLADLRVPDSWPSRPNRLTISAHEATKEKALRFGLVDECALARFDRGAFALLSGYVCPDAPLDRLVLFNDWHSWLFFFDDQVDEASGRQWQGMRLEDYMDACLAVLRTGRLRPGATGLECFTQDVHQRLVHYASADWLARFADDVADYLFKGTLKAAENWVRGMVPAVDAYVEQRRYDSAVYTCQDLLEIIGEGLELSGYLLRDPLFLRLRHLCTDVVAFSNDIFSYEKEVLVHGNPNNLLHVVMVRQELSLSDAVDRAIGAINRDIDAFIATERELAAEIEGSRKLSAYVEGLKAWMRGNVLWSVETGRYASPTSPFPELRLCPGVPMEGVGSD